MVVAGAQRRYPRRVVTAVPPGGAYPAGYRETETVLVQDTSQALLTVIGGNLLANRNRWIREMYGQTGNFADGVAVECPNIQITNQVSFINWISWLPSWTFGIHIPRVQIIRERAGGGGPPDTPPTTATRVARTAKTKPPRGAHTWQS